MKQAKLFDLTSDPRQLTLEDVIALKAKLAKSLGYEAPPAPAQRPLSLRRVPDRPRTPKPRR